MDISAGVGIPVSSRLKAAVRQVRVAAAEHGDRLEQFRNSEDPLRRRTRVTRYQRRGTGDELGAKDALLACRKSVASMAEMKRACEFEAKNPASIAPAAFGQMADTADGAMRLISGVVALARRSWRTRRRSRPWPPGSPTWRPRSAR